MEILSLKWNNHQRVFTQRIGDLRKKAIYADATLACNGKFYQVHKLILSTCSDYFNSIFDQTPCKTPVIVLKDISCRDLEYLLDYVYAGEVNVRQMELPSLITAAEHLQIKGLAVPDDLNSISESTIDKETNDKFEDEPASTSLDNKGTTMESSSDIKSLSANVKMEVLDDDSAGGNEDNIGEGMGDECGSVKEEESHSTLEMFDGADDISNGVPPSPQHLQSVSYDPAAPFLQLASGVGPTRRRSDASPRGSYECSYCGRLFSHRTNQLAHERIHTGEKPFGSVRFVKSTTGREKLVDDRNYAYNFHKMNSDGTKSYWRCTKSICKARVHLENSNITNRISEHCHDP